MAESKKKPRDYPDTGQQDYGGEPKPDVKPVYEDDPDNQVGVDKATDPEPKKDDG